MKLIWHIIKKDFVRDRWALLLWSLLFVAQMGVGVALLHDTGSDRDWIQWMQFASAGLVVAQILMGYVLVARLVQADILLGTDMFWITRPITPGRLLAAKVLGAILLFGLLPVALLAPWWLWCGFGTRDLFWTGVDTFGWQMLMMAPAFLVASLTNDLGRVLMWSVLLFVATLMGIGTVASALNIGSGVGAGTAYTRGWLACMLIVFGSFGIAVYQYRTRRLTWSIGLTVALVGMIAGVALFSGFNFARRLAGLTEQASSPEAATALAGLKVEVGVASAGSPQQKKDLESSVITEVYFQGLPATMAIIAGENLQTWRWSDGLAIKRPSYIGSGPRRIENFLTQTYTPTKPARDPETAAYMQAEREKEDAARAARGLGPLFRGQTMIASSRPGYRALLYANVPKAMLARMSQDPAAYESRLAYAVTQPAVIAELPLQAGMHGGKNSITGRVLWENLYQKDGKPNDMAASVIVTAPLLRRNGLWLSGAVAPDLQSLLGGDIYAVNRITGAIYRTGGYSAKELRNVVVAGVVMNWNFPSVPSLRVVRNGVWVEQDPQWAEHTTLVLVSEQIIARRTAELKTDRLEYRPSLWQSPEVKPTAVKN